MGKVQYVCTYVHVAVAVWATPAGSQESPLLQKEGEAARLESAAVDDRRQRRGGTRPQPPARRLPCFLEKIREQGDRFLWYITVIGDASLSSPTDETPRQPRHVANASACREGVCRRCAR